MTDKKILKILTMNGNILPEITSFNILYMCGYLFDAMQIDLQTGSQNQFSYSRTNASLGQVQKRRALATKVY